MKTLLKSAAIHTGNQRLINRKHIIDLISDDEDDTANSSINDDAHDFPIIQMAQHIPSINKDDSEASDNSYDREELGNSTNRIVTGITSIPDDDLSNTIAESSESSDMLFPLPPRGHLEHPHLGWIIDEVTMEMFMRQWAKQEGFAVTKNTNRKAVYWRCIHYGKYRNRYNLPNEVTEKSKRRELQDRGTDSA